MLLLLHIRSRLCFAPHQFFNTTHAQRGGGITVFLLRNTVYPPPPSISVFLALWEGGRSDGIYSPTDDLKAKYNGSLVTISYYHKGVALCSL